MPPQKRQVAPRANINDWIYEDKPVKELPENTPFNGGFVYIITNITKKKSYIGKKIAHFRRKRPPLKNKTRNRLKFAESDWRTYTGSSAELNDDIKRGDKIKRVIVKWCDNKSEMSWWEAKLIIENDALRSEDWYNSWLDCTITGKNLLP